MNPPISVLLVGAIDELESLRTQLAASSAREARLREALEAQDPYVLSAGDLATEADRAEAEAMVRLRDAALADPPRPVEGPPTLTQEQIRECLKRGAVDAREMAKHVAPTFRKPGALGSATPPAPAPRYTREEVEAAVAELTELLRANGHALDDSNDYALLRNVLTRRFGSVTPAPCVCGHWPDAHNSLGCGRMGCHCDKPNGATQTDPFGPTCDATHPTHGRCLAPVGHTGPHGSDRDAHWPATPEEKP